MTGLSIKAGGEDFPVQLQSDNKTWHFIVSYEFAQANPNALKNATVNFTISPKATSSVPAKDGQVDLSGADVTIKVTAEDGTTADYIIHRIDGKSNHADIVSFKLDIGGEEFSGEVIDSERKVTVDFPFDLQDELENITAIFEVSLRASSVPASGAKLNFTDGPVTIKVTAEDGTTKVDWRVEIVLGPNSKTDVLTFSLKVGTENFVGIFDKGNFKISIGKWIVWDVWGTEYKAFVFPYDLRTALANAIPTFTLSTGATTSFESGQPHSFAGGNTIVFTVTAQDGIAKQDWTLEIPEPQQANITYFYIYFFEGTQPPPNFPTDDPDAIRIQSHETGLPRHGVATIDTENGIITYEPPVMPDWFTPEKMKDIYPLIDVDWSTYDHMEPGPNDRRDFTKDVEYILYAKDGSPTTWTVKAPKYYMKEKWGKDMTGINAAGGNQAPNSVALIDDYVNLGRTDILLNKSDGQISATKLNITGWRDWNGKSTAEEVLGTITQDYPFFVTNDDEGNMVGINLGAWNTEECVIAKWTTATEDPVVVAQFPTKAEGTQLVSFGRKLQILGDINGNGLIISPNNVSATSREQGENYLSKIAGGTVDVANPTIVKTNIPMNGNAYQILTPLGLEPVGPYYVGSTRASDPHGLWYGQASSLSDIMAPLSFKDKFGAFSGKNGWGNRAYHYQKLFEADGNKMIATFSMSQADANNLQNYNYCFGVFERNPEGKLVLQSFATIPYIDDADNNVNGNVTGGFTMEKVGNDIFFYVFPTNKGVYCYQLIKI